MNEEAAALSYTPPQLSVLERIVAWWKRFSYRPERDSNLVKHAEFELRRAGLFDKDADYGGMIGYAVMKMVQVVAAEGHSGMSHGLTMEIFNRVVNFKTLTPITNDESEWCNVSEYGGPNGEKIWQNRRQSSCFSNDGGKTYYDIDDKARTIKVAPDAK